MDEILLSLHGNKAHRVPEALNYSHESDALVYQRNMTTEKSYYCGMIFTYLYQYL